MEQVATVTSQAEVADSIKGLILSNLERIEGLKKARRTAREMLDSALINDEVFKKHDDEAKQAIKKRKGTKDTVLSMPENFSLNEKIKAFGVDIKETQESMSEYLSEYKRLTGENEIEDKVGKMLRIVPVFKLKPVQGRLFD